VGEANRLGKSVDGARMLLAKIVKARNTAVNDNNTIYLQEVPGAAATPAIKRHDMAKPNPLASMEGHREADDPFAQLVPLGVQRALDEYRERAAAQEAKAWTDEAGGATDTTRASLASVGLPAAVEAGEDSVGLPDGVWAKVVGVRQAGGLPALRQLRSDNAGMAQRVAQELE
jgi:hypothetical protein